MQDGQQAECVTVRLLSVDGAQQDLSLPRSASLGELQKQLCRAFRKPFPIRQAGLIIGGVAYNDFLDKPLAAVKESESISVVFSITTDMTFIGRCWPRMKVKTFEEDMREP